MRFVKLKNKKRPAAFIYLRGCMKGAAAPSYEIRRSDMRGPRDRSLPRPVGETGRRSVGNRKERLRDYSSSPDRLQAASDIIFRPCAQRTGK